MLTGSLSEILTLTIGGVWLLFGLAVLAIGIKNEIKARFYKKDE